MNTLDRNAKIKWFCLRTGCLSEEAFKFLEIAKWKTNIAIKERQKYWKFYHSNQISCDK